MDTGRWKIIIYIAPDVPLAYSSSSVTQTNTYTVATGATNQQIIGIPVVATSNICGGASLTVTSFDLNTNGTTTDDDLTNAKIYYTGSSSTFATTTWFGTQALPCGAYTITGSQALTGGTNYFWLAYDVSTSATYGDFLDAECTALTVGGTAYTPTAPTAPAGNRMIDSNYCIPTFSTGCAADMITRVNINSGGINNTSTCSASPYYTLYASATTNLTLNTSYTQAYTVTASSTADKIIAYIDYNHDGDFSDAGEQIASVSITATGSSTPVVGNLRCLAPPL